jgi:cytochrome c5
MISKNKILFLVLLILIGVTTALLVGCGGQTTEAEPQVEQQEAPQHAPAEQEAPQEPAAQQEPADAEAAQESAIDGKTLLEERCTGCHSLEKAQSGERDLAGWQAVIDDMIEKGAKLNEEEAKVLAEYLANME